ncbi:MAG TPA: 50S ribosomal protein L21 [Thermoanaerobaculia bacterium]|nr:50S ribosomal protein L21 [Thermoanaerobaculia bacterium]HUM29243.1 50S ribosomal protein L21 [Thermoanaerobaculia bacterium]HXK67799.1 50S ribosomal protein L21 [Thermoanaerobaculia bacterium]
MYAIIETGSKQYRVKPGDTLAIEITPSDEGKVIFDRVLAVKKEDDLQIGRPVLDGVTVVGSVLQEFKADKIIVFKKKRRKQYKRTRGHRQQLLKIKIESIEGV